MNQVNPNWKFSEIDCKGKNIIVIGDSQSAEGTYQNAGKTYLSIISKVLGANFKKNYAIGGTTATYMYEGSNIEKEYKNNEIAIDGVRIAKRAFDNHELDDVDIAFIEFGHNDQYFQPPITVKDDDVYNVENFDNCHSFKGSYRFIVNILRKANPNIRIIILNCTYSEYDARSNQWEYILGYPVYRKAIEEIAHELECKYIDPWDDMKPIFDGTSTKQYYHDNTHLSPKGHDFLANLILRQ